MRKQSVVIQTIFWHMGIGNLLLVFETIFVLMAHTDGITIWKHPSMVTLSDNFTCTCIYILLRLCISFFLFFPHVTSSLAHPLCQFLMYFLYLSWLNIIEMHGELYHSFLYLLHALKSFSVNFASEVKLEEAAVLYCTYPKFSDLTSRHDQCGCKPTKEDVKRCFMFMAVSPHAWFFFVFVLVVLFLDWTIACPLILLWELILLLKCLYHVQ